MPMIRVGVTGGIGSGKSTFCRLLAESGAPLYDSDAAAKRLMAGELREAIEARFGAESYRDGELDRRRMAGVVFADPGALADLNSIVHPAVRRDFECWASEQRADYVVLESAILFESGFDKAVDKTVAVLAPEKLRIERTCRRDSVSEEQVRSRMAAQAGDDFLASHADYTVVNIFEEDLAAAARALDQRLRHAARRA